MDFMALADTKAAASLASSLGNALGGGAAPISSGASLDGRSWIDGSGWTVATGAAKATGGDREQATDPAGAQLSGSASQAGMSLPLLLLVGLLFAGFVRRAS